MISKLACRGQSELQTVVYDILPSGGRCRKAVFGVWGQRSSPCCAQCTTFIGRRSWSRRGRGGGGGGGGGGPWWNLQFFGHRSCCVYCLAARSLALSRLPFCQCARHNWLWGRGTWNRPQGNSSSRRLGQAVNPLPARLFVLASDKKHLAVHWCTALGLWRCVRRVSRWWPPISSFAVVVFY